MQTFAKASDPLQLNGLLTAEQADKNRIPLRLIGYRVPHTDERCPRRAPGGMYCRSMRGHEGAHIALDPYDNEARVVWL